MSPLLGAEKRAYLVGVVRVPPVSVVLSLAYVRVPQETPNQHTAVLPLEIIKEIMMLVMF